MVFSSLTFLFLFLPAVIIAYYTVPKALKNAVLFFFSLVFYAWGEPVYVVLMLFSTVLDFTCGKQVEQHRGTRKAKAWLLISIIVNLALLGFFKYGDFLLSALNTVFGTSIPMMNLPLPIGISFYTFQTMSYTIDIYRGDAKPQDNIISFGAYVSLFPQLIAGPIVRYQTVAEQLEGRKTSFAQFSSGVGRFTVGLCKKVLIANGVGELWKTVSSLPVKSLDFLTAWLGIVAFALQIYFDFSGYSDMAIGLGRMFGFSFPENFNYPYIRASITDFWRSWHISLGTWFRDYVYIPLGGSRRGLARQIINLLAVWFLTGLWHGASWNYALWGLYYCALLIIEKCFLLKILRKKPAIGIIYTLFAVLLGYVLFAFEDITAGISYFGAMFGGTAVSSASVYRLVKWLPTVIIAVIGSTPLPKSLWKKAKSKLPSAVIGQAEAIGIIAMLAVSVAYLVAGSYNPFLYFRF